MQVQPRGVDKRYRFVYNEIRRGDKRMRLYHGGTVIVDKPKLIPQNRYLDFGFGFYTTANREQARQFALKVAASRKGLPIVNTYEFNESILSDQINIIKFEDVCGEWLDFVSQNRTGTYSGINYDLAIGPVANDDVYRTVQIYLAGIIRKEQALESLKVKRLFKQYVFASEQALSLLKFVCAEELKDD